MKKIATIKFIGASLAIIGILFLSIVPVLATDGVPTSGLLKGVPCAGTGQVVPPIAGQPGSTYKAAPICGLCDMIRVAVNLSDMIVSVSGAIAVLIFVYAGIMYLMVGIKPEYAAKAKGAITAALIGLVFIFGGYALINFTIMTLLGGDSNMGNLYSITGQSGSWGVCATPPAKK